MHNSYDFVVTTGLYSRNENTVNKSSKIQKETKKLDLTALLNENIATAFKEQTLNILSTINTEQDNTNINKTFVKSISETADNVLPLKTKSKLYQTWHDDEKLKQLYQQKDEYIIEFPNSNKLKAIKKKKDCEPDISKMKI